MRPADLAPLLSLSPFTLCLRSPVSPSVVYARWELAGLLLVINGQQECGAKSSPPHLCGPR